MLFTESRGNGCIIMVCFGTTWQSFLGEVGQKLEVFNNVILKHYDDDSAERALLLLLECAEGVQCQMGSGDEDTSHLALAFTCAQPGLDIGFIFDIFRLVDKLIYEMDVHFVDGKTEPQLQRQREVAGYFVKNDGNKAIPPFVHNLRIRSQTTANELISFAKTAPLLREFGLERAERSLETLVEVFKSGSSKQELERIRIDRYNAAIKVGRVLFGGGIVIVQQEDGGGAGGSGVRRSSMPARIPSEFLSSIRVLACCSIFVSCRGVIFLGGTSSCPISTSPGNGCLSGESRSSSPTANGIYSSSCSRASPRTRSRNSSC